MAKKTATKKKTPSSSAAIKAWDAGTDLLHKKKYKAAMEKFQAVLGDESADETMTSRAEQFIRICRNRVDPPKADDADPYIIAVIDKNRGDLDKALEAVETLVRRKTDQEKHHHLAASVYALRGDSDKALDHLAKALELNPALVYQVRQDPDFDSVKWVPRYREMIASAAG